MKKELNKIELENMKVELIKKEKEFDLRLKGLNENIVNENKEKALLEKDIDNILYEIDCINNDNISTQNQLKLSQFKYKTDYDNYTINTYINNYNYNQRIQNELDKQDKLSHLISNINQQIDYYKTNINQIQNEHNLEDKNILNDLNNMKDFISNI